MTKTRKQWKDLSAGQKAIIIVGGIIQFGLMAAAQADIQRRPAEQMRGGNKAVWRGVALINWVGPLAYFFFGRI